MLSSAGMVLIAPLGSGLEMVRENNPSPTPAKANPTRTAQLAHHPQRPIVKWLVRLNLTSRQKR